MAPQECLEEQNNNMTWWGEKPVIQINGFWFVPEIGSGVVRVLNDFKPLPDDVILASFPKTGTTWLKSLLFAIINRSKNPTDSSLVNHHPHVLVPSLEMQVFGKSNGQQQYDLTDSRRLFSTHIPYQLLSKSTLDSANCRVVYITRNPKDTLVSLWHFANKWKAAENGDWSIEEAVEKFCSEIIPFGPYHDHVMGFRKASLENPQNFFFITYEDLMEDTKTHVKRLAEFLGCPFDKEEDLLQVVKSCSFDTLRNYEVNKSENHTSWHEVPYNAFFRRGVVGDYKNYLDAKAVERIDKMTIDKFLGAGFMYGI